MEKFAIGIDFGGTKVAAGLVNLETGRLVAAAKKKTRNVQEQDNVLKRMQAVIDELLSESGVEFKDVKGIGIGVAGMVDRQRGVLLAAANIGANDLLLAEPVSKLYGLPCRIGNDVEVATYAELHYGAGRNCDSFICIFIGTGIGSGIVNDGVLRLGATATAGEIGHMVLIPEGRQCGCGAFGCLETYASRTAVAKSILADLERGADSVIRDKVDLSKGILRSKAIAQAIMQGDQLVTDAVTRAAEFLGIGLASVINFYNPKRIILGGGLVEAAELYVRVAEREAKRRALKIPARKVEIVKAELGDYAGIIGAALLMK
jgi:glucokinase